MAKSERTKMIEESKVDPDEDILTRGVRSAVRGLALGASNVADVAGAGAEAAAKYAKKKEPTQQKEETEQEKQERYGEIRREARGKLGKYKEFEVPEPIKVPDFMKKRGGGKVGYKSGGSVSARADGCAQRGKTRGKMV